jgi:hypothetical protein
MSIDASCSDVRNESCSDRSPELQLCLSVTRVAIAFPEERTVGHRNSSCSDRSPECKLKRSVTGMQVEAIGHRNASCSDRSPECKLKRSVTRVTVCFPDGRNTRVAVVSVGHPSGWQFAFLTDGMQVEAIGHQSGRCVDRSPEWQLYFLTNSVTRVAVVSIGRPSGRTRDAVDRNDN